MEIMYPIVIIICFVLGIIVFFIRINRKSQFLEGKKVANTGYLKETKYYKLKLKKYLFLKNTIKFISFILIVISGILIARPVSILTKREEIYNRDIIIGLDISTSQNEVNLKLIEKFKKILKDIDGDRVGIVIFNTSPIVFCPLTNDYDYIQERFDYIEMQIKSLEKREDGYYLSNETNNIDTYSFWNGGVLVNNEEKGSSLVGDGLVGTILSFPDLNENDKRTRIILFATDNAVQGTETVSLDDACKFCDNYNIKLYAYCPTEDINFYATAEKIKSYKKAVEGMENGKFYMGDLEKMSSSIVEEIKNTKESVIKTSKKTIIIDHPEWFFISIVILYIVLIILEKRIKI